MGAVACGHPTVADDITITCTPTLAGLLFYLFHYNASSIVIFGIKRGLVSTLTIMNE